MLLKFSKSLDETFFSQLRSLSDAMWAGSWYGVVLVPIIIMLAINGIRFAVGEFDGDKYKGLLKKFFYSLLFMAFGLFGMPATELLATYLNTSLVNQVGHIPESMYNVNRQKMAAAGKRVAGALAEAAAKGDAGDPEVTAFINGLSAHERILFDQMTLDAAKDMSNVLLPDEAERLQAMISESGAMSKGTDKVLQSGMTEFKNASKLAEKWEVYRNMDPEKLMLGGASDEISFWSMSFADIVTLLFTLIGALFKLIITFIRGCLLFVFRVSLPISIALSFIPTFEGAVKEWFSNYKTLALMLVTITCIEALMAASWLITRTSVDISSAGFINAVVAFIGGILYLLVPTITVMLFGGSQAMAGLGQQITTTMGVMLGLSKMAGSLMYNKDEKTGKKSGALVIGQNIISGLKDIMKKGTGGSGGDSGPTPPPVV
ncbi:MAG: hypothetical protein LBK47_08450 [Prevotellaceae bacterium]|nr:hypothetical protein [Prevotellaceae bacterium]